MHLHESERIRSLMLEDQRVAGRVRLARALRAQRRAEIAVRRAERAAQRLGEVRSGQLQLARS